MHSGDRDHAVTRPGRREGRGKHGGDRRATRSALTSKGAARAGGAVGRDQRRGVHAAERFRWHDAPAQEWAFEIEAMGRDG
jgi:hypothetical protein